MAAIRFRRAELTTSARSLGPVLLALVIGVTALVPSLAVAGDDPLRDAPVVWYEDDRRSLDTVPDARDPNLKWDQFNESITRPLGYYLHPGRFVRRLSVPFGGEREKSSPNVNALGEVPNSSWFTNRIGLFALTPEDVAQGPGRGEGPSREGPWTIVAAKTQGVTPGFTIRDIEGDLYLLKCDPPEYPSMSTAAGVISSRILHAAGYNVPDDAIVFCRPERLELGENVLLTVRDGSRRPMTEVDVQEILATAGHESDGSIRVISSRLVDGQPIGPFDFKGRRDDDPNDVVKHHHRRELRGLEVFAAWLNHFDTKQHNTLDVLVEEDGRRYVKHYLIDFASTLGAGASGPAQRFGWEVTVDPKAFLGRWLALGAREDEWRQVQRPQGLDEVGYFEATRFDPMGFEPLNPNPAFMRITTADGYWAAKIVSAFTDQHLRAIVEEGRYEDPRAAEYVARILGERRDAIARAWFEKIAPLDFFRLEDGVLWYRDLAVERGIEPASRTRYRTRVSAVNSEREAQRWSTWTTSEICEAVIGEQLEGGPTGYPFLAVQCSVDRGRGWSAPITAYVARGSGRVVAVEREKS